MKSTNIDSSPKKSAAISESTSAISKDYDYEDGTKFPSIKKGYNADQIRDFTFPFAINTDSSSLRSSEKRSVRPNRISEGHNIRSQALSPVKSPQKDLRRMQYSSAHKGKQLYLGAQKASISSASNKKGQKENSMSKSRSLAKYTQDQISQDSEGYDTDRLIAKKKNNLEKGKTTNNSMFTLQSDEYTPNNILPVYESSTDEDSPLFDLVSENAFEELCKLADENTPLPDIWQRKREILESTFRYQPEADQSVNESHHGQY